MAVRAALLLALAACSLPERTLVAYDGPRRPPDTVARVDEAYDRDTLDVPGSGAVNIVELDGQPVDVPHTLELLPGEHELLVSVAWYDPAAGPQAAQARLRVTLEAGQLAVLVGVRRSTERMFVQLEDAADRRVLAWVPAE